MDLSNFYLILLNSVSLCVIAISKYAPIVVDLPSDQNIEDVKVFTNEDIAEFDDSNSDLPIFMAVKGVVFDVTEGRSFYGKGNAYNALAGKDCTRAVAKMSLDPSDFTPDISGLNDEFLKSLDDIYRSVYVAKYPVVGYMDYLIQDIRRRPLVVKDDL